MDFENVTWEVRWTDGPLSPSSGAQVTGKQKEAGSLSTMSVRVVSPRPGYYSNSETQ